MTERRERLKQRLVWMVEQVDGISLVERDTCYRAIERVDGWLWVE